MLGVFGVAVGTVAAYGMTKFLARLVFGITDTRYDDIRERGGRAGFGSGSGELPARHSGDESRILCRGDKSIEGAAPLALLAVGIFSEC